jgi:hypothetical protein
MIILWQFEDCEDSQPVRARLTALAVDFVAINAPEGHPEKDAVMKKLFGSARTPALWDTQTGALVQGERACLEYVGQAFPPREP